MPWAVSSIVADWRLIWRFGIFLGPVHQGHDLVEFRPHAAVDRAQVLGAVALLEPVGGLGQSANAVRHIGKGRHIAHQGLADRFGQALRLHQRLPCHAELLRHLVGLVERKNGHTCQEQQGHAQQNAQHTLVLGRCACTQGGQCYQVGVHGLGLVLRQHLLCQRGRTACCHLPGDQHGLGRLGACALVGHGQTQARIQFGFIRLFGKQLLDGV